MGGVTARMRLRMDKFLEEHATKWRVRPLVTGEDEIAVK